MSVAVILRVEVALRADTDVGTNTYTAAWGVVDASATPCCCLPVILDTDIKLGGNDDKGAAAGTGGEGGVVMRGGGLYEGGCAGCATHSVCGGGVEGFVGSRMMGGGQHFPSFVDPTMLLLSPRHGPPHRQVGCA